MIGMMRYDGIRAGRAEGDCVWMSRMAGTSKWFTHHSHTYEMSTVFY